MKDILKNKTAAVVITVVLVLLGLIIGTARPFGNMKDEALVYFNGNDEIIGIKQDLETKVDTAYSLISVAKRYISEGDILISDLQESCEKVLQSKTPNEAFEANEAMSSCFYELSKELSSKKLSKQDSDYNQSIPAQFQSSDMIISHNKYNALAEEINEKMDKFPANILTKIAFVGDMPLYDNN